MASSRPASQDPSLSETDLMLPDRRRLSHDRSAARNGVRGSSDAVGHPTARQESGGGHEENGGAKNSGYQSLSPEVEPSDDRVKNGCSTSRQNGEIRTVVELDPNSRLGHRVGVRHPTQTRASRRMVPENNRPRRDEEVQFRSKAKKGPQLFAAVSVSTGCLSYGICMAYTSSAIPSMMSNNSTIHIGNDEATWMSSLLALGALFGSLSAVYLMDAVGRKASLLAFSVMSLFIGWTLLMAASQAWQLYVGRVLLGLGAGLEITISPVYIHETTKSEMRDVCGSFPQVMTALGIVCCYVMGRSLSWNWLSLAACVFLVPFIFGLYYIPESPPWLVYNEEEDLAFRSMAQIRGEEYDATQEINRIKETLTLHKNDLHALVTLDNHLGDEEEIEETFRFRDIFERSVLQPFLVILMLMFLLQFSGQGAITFYTVQIFQDARSMVEPKDCALIIGITYFISALISLVLKNLVGRRLLMLISELGMAVSQLGLGIYFYSLAQLLAEDEERDGEGGVGGPGDEDGWLTEDGQHILVTSLNVSGLAGEAAGHHNSISAVAGSLLQQATVAALASSSSSSSSPTISALSSSLSSSQSLLSSSLRAASSSSLLSSSSSSSSLLQMTSSSPSNAAVAAALLSLVSPPLNASSLTESPSSLASISPPLAETDDDLLLVGAAEGSTTLLMDGGEFADPRLTIDERIEHISWLPLPLLMLFTVAFNVGMGSLTWVVATEVLPVRSRGWTHTMANLTSNFWWFVVTKTFKDIEARLGLCAPFFFYGSVCIFGLVFIYVFLPETRGRTYEETAQSFVGVRPIIDRIGVGYIKDCVFDRQRRANKRTPS